MVTNDLTLHEPAECRFAEINIIRLLEHPCNVMRPACLSLTHMVHRALHLTSRLNLHRSLHISLSLPSPASSLSLTPSRAEATAW